MLNLLSIHGAIALYLVVPLVLATAALWVGQPREGADLDHQRPL